MWACGETSAKGGDGNAAMSKCPNIPGQHKPGVDAADDRKSAAFKRFASITVQKHAA